MGISEEENKSCNAIAQRRLLLLTFIWCTLGIFFFFFFLVRIRICISRPLWDCEQMPITWTVFQTLFLFLEEDPGEPSSPLFWLGLCGPAVLHVCRRQRMERNSFRKVSCQPQMEQKYYYVHCVSEVFFSVPLDTT